MTDNRAPDSEPQEKQSEKSTTGGPESEQRDNLYADSESGKLVRPTDAGKTVPGISLNFGDTATKTPVTDGGPKTEPKAEQPKVEPPKSDVPKTEPKVEPRVGEVAADKAPKTDTTVQPAKDSTTNGNAGKDTAATQPPQERDVQTQPKEAPQSTTTVKDIAPATKDAPIVSPVKDLAPTTATKDAPAPQTAVKDTPPASEKDVVQPAAPKDTQPTPVPPKDIAPSSTKEVAAPVNPAKDIAPPSTKEVAAPANPTKDIAPSSTKDVAAPVNPTKDIAPSSTKDVAAPVNPTKDIAPSSTKDVTAPVNPGKDIDQSSIKDVAAPVNPGKDPTSTKDVAAPVNSTKDVAPPSTKDVAPVNATREVAPSTKDVAPVNTTREVAPSTKDAAPVNPTKDAPPSTEKDTHSAPKEYAAPTAPVKDSVPASSVVKETQPTREVSPQNLGSGKDYGTANTKETYVPEGTVKEVKDSFTVRETATSSVVKEPLKEAPLVSGKDPSTPMVKDSVLTAGPALPKENTQRENKEPVHDKADYTQAGYTVKTPVEATPPKNPVVEGYKAPENTYTPPNNKNNTDASGYEAPKTVAPKAEEVKVSGGGDHSSRSQFDGGKFETGRLEPTDGGKRAVGEGFKEVPPSNVKEYKEPNAYGVSHAELQTKVASAGSDYDKTTKRVEDITGGKDVPTFTGGKDVPTFTSGKDVPTYTGGKDAPTYTGGKDAPTYTGGKDAPTYTGGKDAPTYTGGKDAPTYGEKVVPSYGGKEPAYGGKEVPTTYGGKEVPTTTYNGKEQAGYSSEKIPPSAYGSSYPTKELSGSSYPDKTVVEPVRRESNIVDSGPPVFGKDKETIRAMGELNKQPDFHPSATGDLKPYPGTNERNFTQQGPEKVDYGKLNVDRASFSDHFPPSKEPAKEVYSGKEPYTGKEVYSGKEPLTPKEMYGGKEPPSGRDTTYGGAGKIPDSDSYRTPGKVDSWAGPGKEPVPAADTRESRVPVNNDQGRYTPNNEKIPPTSSPTTSHEGRVPEAGKPVSDFRGPDGKVETTQTRPADHAPPSGDRSPVVDPTHGGKPIADQPTTPVKVESPSPRADQSPKVELPTSGPRAEQSTSSPKVEQPTPSPKAEQPTPQPAHSEQPGLPPREQSVPKTESLKTEQPTKVDQPAVQPLKAEQPPTQTIKPTDQSPSVRPEQTQPLQTQPVKSEQTQSVKPEQQTQPVKSDQPRVEQAPMPRATDTAPATTPVPGDGSSPKSLARTGIDESGLGALRLPGDGKAIPLSATDAKAMILSPDGRALPVDGKLSIAALAGLESKGGSLQEGIKAVITADGRLSGVTALDGRTASLTSALGTDSRLASTIAPDGRTVSASADGRTILVTTTPDGRAGLVTPDGRVITPAPGAVDGRGVRPEGGNTGARSPEQSNLPPGGKLDTSIVRAEQPGIRTDAAPSDRGLQPISKPGDLDGSPISHTSADSTTRAVRDPISGDFIDDGGDVEDGEDGIIGIRKLKGEKRYLTGVEIAIAGLLTAAAIAKAKTDSEELINGNVDTEELLEQMQAKEGDEETDPQDVGNTSVLKRRTHLVMPGDTLPAIAEKFFQDSSLGWLIADLNAGAIKETRVDGKIVIELRARQLIELPDYQDIQEFRSKRLSQDRVDETMVTIVSDNSVDKELLQSFLGQVTGDTSAKPAAKAPAAKAPVAIPVAASSIKTTKPHNLAALLKSLPNTIASSMPRKRQDTQESQVQQV